MTLVSRIKEVAKKQHMSLIDVALKAGIAENSIYGWTKKTPKADTLSKVAKVLNVSIDYLLGETQNPNGGNNITELPDLKEVDRDVLSYDGRPISERDWQIIKNILETGLDE